MNSKISFLLLILIILSSFVLAKSYSIDNYEINYIIHNSGDVMVNEKIEYNLSGCFHELFITKPVDLIIKEENGFCVNKECNFRIDSPDVSISGKKELILSGDFCDTKVTANFSYVLSKVIRELKDATQFYYKIYGDETEVPANVKLTIELSGKVSETKYYLHPIIDFKISLQEDVLTISKQMPSNQMIEINLLMPKDWFDSNGLWQYSGTVPTKQEVIDEEENWIQASNNMRVWIVFSEILQLLFFFLPLLFLILVWFLYGKEYKKEDVNYFGEYERDLPSQISPLKANYLIKGTFSNDWFGSALMYLVWKKYFNISKDKDDFTITIGKTVPNDLPKEIDLVYKYVVSKMKNNSIKVSYIKSTLILDSGFLELYNNVKNVSNNWFKSNNYLEKKGYNLFGMIIFVQIVSILLFMLLSFVISMFLSTALIYFGTIVYNNILIGLIVGFVILIIVIMFIGVFGKSYEIVFGRWTKDARILNLKWTNFKHYISDFSLMKEHPPESVEIWEHYLVYATAFGVAEVTAKALKAIAPELAKDNRFMTNTAFINTYSANSFTPISLQRSSSGHSVGGFGGGFGGGGAGAR